MLTPLDRNGLAAAKKTYADHAAFFPLIAAVLAGSQPGKAFGDDAQNPRQTYVEHAFGFAQVFGASVPDFEASLEDYLLRSRDFSPDKVRLYTPDSPVFCQGEALRAVRSERQRFFLDPRAYAAARLRVLARSCPQASPQAGAQGTIPVSPENVAAMDAAFDLVNRFWPDAASFAAHSLARVALHQGQPAAICYAAALENHKAEIDILTLPQFRGKGLGMLAAVSFMDGCLARGVAPLWDCFTNNAGSMALRERLGFVNRAAPYPFYTIAR